MCDRLQRDKQTFLYHRIKRKEHTKRPDMFYREIYFSEEISFIHACIWDTRNGTNKQTKRDDEQAKANTKNEAKEKSVTENKKNAFWRFCFVLNDEVSRVHGWRYIHAIQWHRDSDGSTINR